HVKLEHTYYPYNDFFHASHDFLENLDSAFLGNLVDAFYKLFSLHTVQKPYSGEMFRSKSGDSLVLDFSSRSTDRVPNRKDSRVKYADDISCIGFVYHMAVLSHHLLRLGQTHFLISLDMVNL